jgi:nucleotide-binding universal stress UspA family protein
LGAFVIALSRHCEGPSLRAAFSREEQSDVAGSNPSVADIDVKSIEAQWAAGAQQVLDKVATSAAAKGVSVKTSVIKSDDISDGLVKAANKMKADLIVMASHGRKGIKRVLLGSETQNVLTHSEVPVLVLR